MARRLASVLRTNSLEKSGTAMTESEVTELTNLSNAVWHSGDHGRGRLSWTNPLEEQQCENSS